MAKIASVVLSNSTREFDKEYYYEIPEELANKIEPGVRVIVPFGRANALKEAFVIDVFDRGTVEGLKTIKKAADEKPVLSKEMIELASWMKERYICTYYDAIKCMLPAGTKVKAYKTVYLKNCNESFIDKIYEKITDENEKLIIDYIVKNDFKCQLDELKANINIKSFSKIIKRLVEKELIDIREEYATGVKEKYVKVAYSLLSPEAITDLIESNKIKRIQQIKVLEILMESEYVPVQDIIKFEGVSPSVVNTLKRYGYIDFKEIEVKRDPFSGRTYNKTEPLEPTAEQKVALQTLREQKDKKQFAEYLLHGITGSGKTEIYLQLIQYTLEKGEQAIVLVPEISLTPQMIDRFKGRFGDQVAVLHSRLSLGERYDQWRLIKEGKVNVVIGARSAVFAPLENIGLIIIDEEHETSYKSEITPKYSAHEIARYICKRKNAILLLGSATPSVETYYKAVTGEIGLLTLKERANKMILPKVEIIDMRE